MAFSISGYSNTINSLFSSLNNSSVSSSKSSDMLGISYSDYATIRSGSYHKLLKQYYKNEANESSSDSGNKTATTAQIKTSAEKMQKTTDKLFASGKNSLFNEVTTKDKDGNETTGYDVEKISSAVKDFVDSYNDVVKTAGSSSSNSITSAAAAMVNYTKVNSNMLSKIGITVKSDNTLEFDKDTFAKADMGTVKSMFNSRGSYGYTMGVQASMINYAAATEDSKTYSNSGSYNYNYVTGESYNVSI